MSFDPAIPFRAFRIHAAEVTPPGRAIGVDAGIEAVRIDELADGDVVIAAEYSTINYKDALAATGAGKILRRFPLVGGIDVAGTVVHSDDTRHAVGDRVLVTGCGLGETHDGGYAELVRVQGDWVVTIPDGFDARWAMSLGTAGFTAGLAIHRLEHNGLCPEAGPVVVTGASGGVGSLAVDILAARGYEVVAVTGKADAADYLRGLGAAEVRLRDEIDLGRRPLESAIWAGAIDNLGGEVLTWLTRTMKFWGGIASIGLTQGHELHTTVMPFILRGVNLLGINSMATPRPLRLEIWRRLSTDLAPQHLDEIITRQVAFDDLPSAFGDYIDNRVRGRALVRIRG